MSFERHDEDVHANVAAYVLGALPEEEHAAFVEHLASCVACREEVCSLGVVAAALPALAPPQPAPGELKRRVMDTVDREAREQEAARTGRQRPVPARRAGDGLGWRPAFAGLAVAAVIAVFAVVLFTSGGGGGTKVFRAQVSAPRAFASVTVSGGHAQLTVAGMPQSPPNHVYELWIKRAGEPEPTDALFTVSRTGAATVGVPGSVQGVKELLVTAEPLGGSPHPTRTPIIIAPLG